MATALLEAIRRAYPHARIVFAVGRWSLGAIADNPAINAFVDVGESANPAKGVKGMWRLVRQLRHEKCDMAFIPDRSPLLGLAVWLARIPHRVGLDSLGRGFAHTVRVPVHPNEEINEAAIYLRLALAIGISTDDIYTHIVIPPPIQAQIEPILADIPKPYIVIHPAGGANPGMVMSSKRWLPRHFARLAEWLHETYGASIVLIGAETDRPIVDAVIEQLHIPYHNLTGTLRLMQIGALGKSAWAYIGNDTGLTHLVAATGTKTVMILGPSSPKRYAPFTPNTLALWKPIILPTGGVAEVGHEWDWERDGIGIDEAIRAIAPFLSGGTA
jgi:ADP-heptose:LPS heptosyltransferase